MSKKSSKPAPAQRPSAKPKTAARQPGNWLARPSTADERDPLFKKIFLGLAAFVLLATLALALNSGINGDDEYQNDYSDRLVRHYASFGEDRDAMKIDTTAKDPFNRGKMYYYGGVFDTMTGAVNSALGLDWQDAGYHRVRHVFNALFGFLAMLFAALLAKEIAGWRAGILALALMFLSPRFLGDSLMNPKDIPFAAGYVAALYFMVVLFKTMPKPHWKTMLGLALGIGLALGTRAGGMILIAYLGLFAALDFLLKNGFAGLVGERKTAVRYAGVVLGISAAGWVLAVLFWPWALQSPLSNPLEALGAFSKLEVKIRVLFESENVMSDQTPWHYPLSWIWRTIPLFTLAGFAGSLVLLKTILSRHAPLPVLMLLFAAVFPVFYVIYKDSVLHDGWRHLTFAYPAMVVLAALFFLALERLFFEKKTVRFALYGVLCLLVLEPAVFIARNASFPYVYFNPLSGGVKGAFGNFETDYWGVSVKQALDWLEKQGKISPAMQDTVTIGTTFSYTSHAYADKKYGGKVRVRYLRFNNRYEQPWDYGIFPSRYIKGAHLRAGTWPNSRSIHEITASGVPLLSVEQGGGAVFEGEKALKAQDFQAAAAAFEQELKDHPDNELAWTKLALARVSLNQFAEARTAAGQLLKVTPDNTNGLFYRGVAALNLNDVPAAQADFERAVAVESDFGSAWYYLALIKSQRNDLGGALRDLQKCIESAPRFKPAYELAAQIYERQGDAQRAAQFRAAAGQVQ